MRRYESAIIRPRKILGPHLPLTNNQRALTTASTNARIVSKTVILLVDDDAERMASTQAVLHGDGHAVFSAPTAEAAVKLCTMLHFDLIVSRVLLPLGGMGGVALAQSPEGSKVRMLLTSHVSRKLLETIPGFVDYDFLPNPFTPDQLIRKVRERLQRPV